MGQTAFSLKENTRYEKCPKCGNNTKFICKSEQCAEDCCEVWVECVCGFDPTMGDGYKRVEDVWGSRDEGTMLMGLDVWNEEIEEARLKSEEEKITAPNSESTTVAEVNMQA